MNNSDNMHAKNVIQNDVDQVENLNGIVCRQAFAVRRLIRHFSGAMRASF